MRAKTFIRQERGNALIEFMVVLPFLLFLFVGMTDLCLLIDDQLKLIHLGREAASVLSRGADFTQTFTAITSADGSLDLDSAAGRVILTRVALDQNGQPVVTAQQSIGGLAESSTVGSQPGGRASIPNGRSIPKNRSLVVVELFAARHHLLGATGYAPGKGQIVLCSLAAF